MQTRQLTPEEIKRRRGRSIAIALGLGILVVFFYVTTMVRLGANIAERVI